MLNRFFVSVVMPALPWLFWLAILFFALYLVLLIACVFRCAISFLNPFEDYEVEYAPDLHSANNVIQFVDSKRRQVIDTQGKPGHRFYVRRLRIWGYGKTNKVA
ncbi:hypothetical protein LOC67_23595 [Stieleria sp. JC731]|nr:hypothetical protein [Stieleria sp. JC731]